MMDVVRLYPHMRMCRIERGMWTRGITRRRFLGWSAALTGSALAPGWAQAHSERVLVIGAGIAGLACARELVSAGLAVTVLEARDRIGGRVHTDRRWPGVALDLGAAWIHGRRHNPIDAIARRLGARLLPTDYDASVLFGPDGREVPARQAAAIEARFEAVMAAVCRLARERRRAGAADLSLGAAIRQVVTPMALSPFARLALDAAINTTIEHEMAADVDDLSAAHWDEGASLPGGDVLFPDGYDAVARHLGAGLDVRLGEVVREIAHGPSGVVVTTARGEHRGARVVVTLPVGVLQHAPPRFSPAWPGDKQRALGRLGMDGLDKGYLRFPRAFWARPGVEVLGHVAAERGRFGESYDYQRVTGAPILALFNAARFARTLEALPDADVVARAMAFLRTIFRDAPSPAGAIVTRWGADPFARGAYSHLPPGATPADRDALAAPLGDRVFFAGEATHRDHPATVHGAFLSGVREARRVGAAVR